MMATFDFGEALESLVLAGEGAVVATRGGAGVESISGVVVTVTGATLVLGAVTMALVFAGAAC